MCNVLFLQWHIACGCLRNLVELVIRAAKVSILLTEKTTTFMYFIEMQIICCFSYRTDIMLIICFGCFDYFKLS
jgi:hypothetical protein